MAKNRNRSPEAEERKLRALEQDLKEIVAAGDWPESETRERPEEEDGGLAEPRAKHILADVRARREQRQKLEKIRRELPAERMSFSQLIAALREGAALSLTEVARNARVKVEELRQLEKGVVSPFEVSPESIAGVAEAFWIPLSVLELSLGQVGEPADAAEAPLARAGRGRDVAAAKQAAVEDMRGFFAARRAVKANVPPGYMEKIRGVLERRGVTALL